MNDASETPPSSPTLQLVAADAPILREKALAVPNNVEAIDQHVMPHIYPMRDIMRKAGGIGLAAPQVGIGLRFFLMVDAKNDGVHIVINPVIQQRFGLRTSKEEGCLSFPGRSTFVPRWQKILLEWRKSNGTKAVQWFTGRDARVIQHETDHLDGICIFQ